MSKFLNDRLILAAKRIKPISQPPTQAPTCTADHDRFNDLVRREEEAVRLSAVREDTSESMRRMEELREDLALAVEDIERTERRLGRHLHALKEVQNELLRCSGRSTPDPEGMRERRRILEAGRIELAKWDNERQAGAQPVQLWLQELRFWRLTGMGFALTWPLVLALLVLAVCMSATLLTVF